MSIKFTDNTMLMQARITKALKATVIECAGEMVKAIQDNSRVDTGQTKRSYSYITANNSDSIIAEIGSDLPNAIYEEFGTGEYALQGNGRKGGWFYSKGKRCYFTLGKKPNRPIYKAYISKKDKLVKRLEDAMGGLGK